MLAKLALGALLLALMFATRSARLAAFDLHKKSERYEAVYYLPPAEWLGPLSLGYTSALADLLWCRTLIYFGEEASHRSVATHAYSYVDAILALDADFPAPYKWIATVAMYRPTPPTREEGERAVVYLRRAVARWPDDGTLRWRLGAFLRFELLPLVRDPQYRMRIDEEATEHLHVAALKGTGPAWLAFNNSTLLMKLGKKEVAIRQLEEVYATVDDEELRRDIAIRLAALRAETETMAFRAAIEDFERQRRESFPYMPGDLFYVVGPKQREAHLRAAADRFAPDVLEDEDAATEEGSTP